MTAPNPLYLTDEQAAERQRLLDLENARRLTLELTQPLTNAHRRRPPRRRTDTPLFERQEELAL